MRLRLYIFTVKIVVTINQQNTTMEHTFLNIYSIVFNESGNIAILVHLFDNLKKKNM